MSERHAQLTTAMLAAGCTAPKDWVHSEVSEDIPQFARFLLLRDVYRAIDAVDERLAEARFDRPELQQTLQQLRDAVGNDALHELLHAYGHAVGNSFVMVLDQGPAAQREDTPGWMLMEVDAEGGPTGRRVDGLHEDYLDFPQCYREPV